jgi:23S rRNA pseudouridine1911/1915/1917 synthase
MSHIGYPLVGDPVYAGRSRLPKGVSQEVMNILKGFKRQALHAGHFELIHPVTQEMVSWEADIPEDFVELIETMEGELKLYGRDEL